MTKQEKAVLRDIIIDLRKSTDLFNDYPSNYEIRKEITYQIDRLYDLMLLDVTTG
jgi:hypothetical protein